MRPVIQRQDIDLIPQRHGARYQARIAAIAAPLGATHLGARWVELAPGKAAWPCHAHYANDEIFVILGGRGVLRFGGADYAVEQGDVAVCPAGGAETAHQLVAGDAGLVYIAISSMREPDVLTYPDSGKIGVFAARRRAGIKPCAGLKLSGAPPM
ncbi:cupin domain protein [Hyphomonas neptunium ATCC 15444]|uniref:Cupin domain protein n=2 Tax=Hyphomonas TaxID=85 RepID=Q0C265_HYPNA|nr:MULTISPECIES: cupin domain-containing protein [Hyphomonas]ABI77866.1 cupin domain protein [Hyphomonas neptunium ATCC 15444]KCZ93110.1 cupin domain-containing protein [Hyphomonas hirschiana VP5]